jgi:hypothetical protein
MLKDTVENKSKSQLKESPTGKIWDNLSNNNNKKNNVL